MHNMSVDQSRPELPQSIHLLGGNTTNNAWCARGKTPLNLHLPANTKLFWLLLLSVEKLPFGLTPAKLHSIAWKGKLRKSLLLMQQMEVLLMPNLQDALTNTQLHTYTSKFDNRWREHVFSLKPWIDHLWDLLRWILCGRHFSRTPKITLLSLVLVLTCVFTQTRDIKSCQYTQNNIKKNINPSERPLFFSVHKIFNKRNYSAFLLKVYGQVPSTRGMPHPSQMSKNPESTRHSCLGVTALEVGCFLWGNSTLFNIESWQLWSHLPTFLLLLIPCSPWKPHFFLTQVDMCVSRLQTGESVGKY